MIPYVGMILKGQSKGATYMVTAVDEETRNFRANGKWYPFSYIGYTFFTIPQPSMEPDEVFPEDSGE